MKAKIMICVFALSIAAHAQVTLTKEVNEIYDAGADRTLDIRNSFGKVKVEHWEKPQIRVFVEVRATASNEDKAQKLLDRIDISYSSSASTIKFVTEHDNLNTKGREEFEISYTVHMPQENPLRIKNSFGDVVVTDRLGATNLDISYGSVKAGNLPFDTQFKLSFGSGSINRAIGGRYEVKYSKLSVDYVGKTYFRQDFSTLSFTQVEDLRIDSKYGSVDMEEADKIDADIQFSGFNIGLLTGSLDLRGSYISNLEVKEVAASFENIDISTKFSTSRLTLDESVSADFYGYFSFSDLNNSAAGLDMHYRVKESNKSEYRGKINGGNPNKTITINSSYGDCRLRQ